MLIAQLVPNPLIALGYLVALACIGFGAWKYWDAAQNNGPEQPAQILVGLGIMIIVGCYLAVKYYYPTIVLPL